MDIDYQNRLKHFTALKSKYQATKYEDSSPSSLLYLILRKADLGIELTELEFDWLKEYELEEALKTIKQEQQHRVKEFSNLEFEFSTLKSKYNATKHNISWQSSHLYFILFKVESGNLLTDSEFNWLKSHGLHETNALIKEMGRFHALKYKYKVINYLNSSPNSPLYKILQQLDKKAKLSKSDINWLKQQELCEIIDIFQQHESEREADFLDLKAKYQATKEPDLSTSSPLYSILQKINSNKKLTSEEMLWLEQHGLTETIAIANELENQREFIALKAKYKATQYEDASPKNHLYKVLKRLEISNQLGEQDLNFLKKRKLNETIAIANTKYVSNLKYKIQSGEILSNTEIDWLKNNGYEDIILLAKEKHFEGLRLKYDVLEYLDKSPSSPLYAILLKLEQKERLEATDIAWLEENKTGYRKLFDGEIRIAYHTIEANFYEQDFKRTGNKWNIANASSHWRKANKPERALQLTNNLEIDKIKENKLKSALLTSRGGALRDIAKLDEAEKCARQAIEYQPKSHHPYTLMGAICFERHQYSEGEYWFQEAIKRGANPRDMDSEIKRVVKNAKDENKRRQVVEYLLKKDPQRYAWAKSYLKKQKDRG
ncbi:hypothetical protein JYQ62_12670 [Nostoc sp. UHCC 0702]|nr:hypothetical protein JYQ62_12670 [Nostoc sp. UHCC 0702]